jgi:flagellar motility protein MotE (MotC chaperone)
MKLRLLPLLVVVAAAGFLLRVGGVWQGLGPMAQVEAAEGDPADAQAETPAEAASPGGAPTRTAALPASPFDLTDEEIDLLQRLAKRRTEIERRGAELEQRGNLLEAAERRIDEKIGELQAIQKTIEGLLVSHDEQSQGQLNSLVKIYENMKPKDAARIFEELDMVVLLDVIERMKERKTAPILAKMNPQRAKEITLELAQRRSLPIARN